jgi:hypothetical protein
VQPRFSIFADYESTTINKKTLCELQNCEAQKRRARDLQKPAAQATPGLNRLALQPCNLFNEYHAKITRS